jgi:hypothetical protein
MNQSIALDVELDRHARTLGDIADRGVSIRTSIGFEAALARHAGVMLSAVFAMVAIVITLFDRDNRQVAVALCASGAVLSAILLLWARSWIKQWARDESARIAADLDKEHARHIEELGGIDHA